jgi:hypothetical protein
MDCSRHYHSSIISWRMPSYFTPRGSCRNGRFAGTYRLQHQGHNNSRARNVSSNLLRRIMIEAIYFSETSVLTRATRRSIPKDDIIHSHRSENLKPYVALTGWALLRRRNVSPMRYEMGFYITEDGIFHSHCRENLKSYIALTGWTL